MQMAAAVAVDGEELSPDGEEPSPDRRHTTRSDDACAQSKTVLQDQAGSGRRGEDKKRAKAAADDDDAGATPLHAPSPGWSGKLARLGPMEAAPRSLVAVKLFPQAKKTAGEPEAEVAVVYPTAVSASALDFHTLKAYTPPCWQKTHKRGATLAHLAHREGGEERGKGAQGAGRRRQASRAGGSR